MSNTITLLVVNDDFLDVYTCLTCKKTARQLQNEGNLKYHEHAKTEYWCGHCGQGLDDGACDPSDDECGHCGFPTFDCKCEDDWFGEGDDYEAEDEYR